MTGLAPPHPVAVGDVRLAVHTSGSGIPLLLLHGFPLDHRMWSRQADLAEHVRLIAPDQRGFGASAAVDPTLDSGPASIEQLADDAVALLDSLHVARPAVVCGLSMGGYVAQHVAARHPDRVAAVVLVDTKLEADTPEAKAARADLAAKAGRLGQAIVADAMIPRLLAAAAESAPGRAGIEAELRRMIVAQPIETIQAALAALAARPDMTDAMRHVRVPALLVVGAEDAITPPECLERALAVMPRARLVIVPGAGHMTPLESPAAFNAAVLAFLAEAGVARG